MVGPAARARRLRALPARPLRLRKEGRKQKNALVGAAASCARTEDGDAGGRFGVETHTTSPALPGGAWRPGTPGSATRVPPAPPPHGAHRCQIPHFMAHRCCCALRISSQIAKKCAFCTFHLKSARETHGRGEQEGLSGSAVTAQLVKKQGQVFCRAAELQPRGQPARSSLSSEQIEPVPAWREGVSSSFNPEWRTGVQEIPPSPRSFLA